MRRIHSNSYNKISFVSAVRRGMSSLVRDQMQGFFEMESFYDENDEKVYPFHVALDHKRWKVALDLLEHRHLNDNLLPPGITFTEEEIEKNKIDNGPVEAGTSFKRAINELLRELALERNDRPLPKSLQDRMLPFLDLLVEVDGLDNTLLRVLSQQPKWLDWSVRLLEAGANPNAFAANKHTGVTIHTLDTAGRNGLEREVDELLKRGANPYYKHHNFDLAAHRVARIETWEPPRIGWLYIPINEGLDLALSRKRCLDRLLEVEGMEGMPGNDGKDPLTLWERGLAFMEDPFFKRIKESEERDKPHLMEKMMDLLTLKAPSQGSSLSSVSRRMRL